MGARVKVQNGCVVAPVMDAQVLTSGVNIDSVYPRDKYFPPSPPRPKVDVETTPTSSGPLTRAASYIILYFI